jgi:hypothetical protein
MRPLSEIDDLIDVQCIPDHLKTFTKIIYQHYTTSDIHIIVYKRQNTEDQNIREAASAGSDVAVSYVNDFNTVFSLILTLYPHVCKTTTTNWGLAAGHGKFRGGKELCS